jgi:hypothetical protein
MSRYYCPQWCHDKKGWIDIDSLASKKEKEANDAAKEFAEIHKVVTRTIRKPHGWNPSNVYVPIKKT